MQLQSVSQGDLLILSKSNAAFNGMPDVFFDVGDVVIFLGRAVQRIGNCYEEVACCLTIHGVCLIYAANLSP